MEVSTCNLWFVKFFVSNFNLKFKGGNTAVLLDNTVAVQFPLSLKKKVDLHSQKKPKVCEEALQSLTSQHQ